MELVVADTDTVGRAAIVDHVLRKRIGLVMSVSMRDALDADAEEDGVDFRERHAEADVAAGLLDRVGADVQRRRFASYAGRASKLREMPSSVKYGLVCENAIVRL